MTFDRRLATSFAASCILHGCLILAFAIFGSALVQPTTSATPPRIDVVRVGIVTEISFDDTPPIVEADDEPPADLAQDVAPTEPSDPAPVPPRPAQSLTPTIPATEPTIGAATTEPQSPATVRELSQGRRIERIVHIEPQSMTLDEFDQLLKAWDMSICWKDWEGTWYHPANTDHADDHSTTASYRLSVTYDFPNRESYVAKLLARRGVHHFRSFALIGSARGRRLIQEIEDARPDRSTFDYVLTRNAIRLRN